MRLENKTALVTGAASGIGESTALRFAEEGAHVVVTDIDEDGGQGVVDKIDDAGGQASFYDLDVTDADQFQSVVDAVVDA